MEISDILQMDQGCVGQNRNIPPRLKKRAQSLCWRYNQSPPGAEGERRIILEQLLGTCHPLTVIEPWFRCDYGFNIPCLLWVLFAAYFNAGVFFLNS